MRYKPEHNDVTRERILDVAGRLFRENGVDGIGLAKIMDEAGLTVGTFYTHFDSKQALLGEAMAKVLDARLRETVAAERLGLEVAVRAYLSREHRDEAGAGCPIAALGPDVARHGRATRNAVMKHLMPSIDVLAEMLGESRRTKVSQEEAMAFFGLLSGTLQLARTTTDRAKADAILEAGIAAALRLAR